MLELIKNKHFSIFIDPHCELVGKRMVFNDVHYVLRSTYATKFQMKKAMKRKIHKILWEHIRNGDTIKGCSKDDPIESNVSGSESVSNS